MREVIYARYSLDHQREESVEGQLRENTVYAKKNGIEIVHNAALDIYADRIYNKD